jgi:hypothetical protein
MIFWEGGLLPFGLVGAVVVALFCNAEHETGEGGRTKPSAGLCWQEAVWSGALRQLLLRQSCPSFVESMGRMRAELAA